MTTKKQPFLLTAYIQKGGTGKTTVLTNLASYLAQVYRDKKIILIEYDHQGNTFDSYGKDYQDLKCTFVDVLRGEAKMQDAIVSLHDGLDILPAGEAMCLWEMEILLNAYKTPNQNPFKHFEKHLKQLVHAYDMILIDAPPSSNAIVANILSADVGIPHHVIVPLKLEGYSVKGMVLALKTIETMRSSNPQVNIMGFLPTMRDLRTTLHTNMLDQMNQICMENEWPLFETYIPLSIMYPQANTTYAMPLTQYEPNHKNAKRFEELWQEIKMRAGYQP